jgi:hypothetical protein
MTKHPAAELIWNTFCNRFNIAQKAVPLFDTLPDGAVSWKTLGKAHNVRCWCGHRPQENTVCTDGWLPSQGLFRRDCGGSSGATGSRNLGRSPSASCRRVSPQRACPPGRSSPPRRPPWPPKIRDSPLFPSGRSRRHGRRPLRCPPRH